MTSDSDTTPLPIVADCMYGLGNRLLCIASALRIGRDLGRPVVVHWPRAQACQAALTELFSTSLRETSSGEAPVVLRQSGFELSKVPDDRLVAVRTWRGIAPKGRNFGDDVRLPRDTLAPCSRLERAADDFLASHGADWTWVGLHLRKGDKRKIEGGNAVARRIDQHAVSVLEALFAQHPGVRVFAASDESLNFLTQRFGKRVVTRPNRHHPHRRKLEAVRESLLNLLILARCGCVLRSIGTFVYAADRLWGVPSMNLLSLDCDLCNRFVDVPGSLPNPDAIASRALRMVLSRGQSS